MREDCVADQDKVSAMASDDPDLIVVLDHRYRPGMGRQA